MDNSKDIVVRSSVSEFLTFELETKENTINVRYEDETLWLTQKMMSELFDVGIPAINEHLKNIFDTGELDKEATIRKFRIVRIEGNREVSREIEHYNLDAAISVGYRVNSLRATQFRRWATNVLRQFTIQGYIIDKKRMENGQIIGEDYFEKLLEEIREIRLSERRLYLKITDIYATSIDYDKYSPISQEFFAKVQNKLHYAVTGYTAGEIVRDRADSTKPHMGLTSWANSPDGKVLRTDVGIAKNYLTKDEIQSMGRIVSAFLDMAEDYASRRIPMTMEDWSKKLDGFISFTGRELLDNAGSISARDAKLLAETEFEKYRIVQDQLYENDYEKLVENKNKKLN